MLCAPYLFMNIISRVWVALAYEETSCPDDAYNSNKLNNASKRQIEEKLE